MSPSFTEIDLNKGLRRKGATEASVAN